MLPPTLTHLTFGSFFDLFVDHLPASLTHLTFGYRFNKPVDSLPPLLTHLKFGSNFDQDVEHLPSKLQLLKFEIRFSKSIDGIPDSIHTLDVSTPQKICKLPSSLTSLHHQSHTDNLYCQFPTPLKYAFITGSQKRGFDFSATQIESLIIFALDPPPLLNNLPNSLKKLELHGQHWDPDINNLPPSLTSLVMNCNVSPENFEHLPHSLTRLIIDYDCLIDGMLSTKLLHF